MVLIAPTSRADMEAAHAAAKTAKAPLKGRTRNVRPVLDLGSTEAILFRGRAYGVPPVPWQAGQRLLDIWTRATSYRLLNDPAVQKEYFAALAPLPGLLWRLTRPVGRIPRLLHRLGLHRNPFRLATEAELVELAAFFLTRRLRSSIGLLPAATALTGT